MKTIMRPFNVTSWNSTYYTDIDDVTQIRPTMTTVEQYDPEGAIVFIVVVIMFYGLSIPCLIGIFITTKKENVPYDGQRDYQKEINQVRAVALRMERLRTLKRAIKHRGSLVEYEDSPSLKFARVTLGSSSSEPSTTPNLPRPSRDTHEPMTSPSAGQNKSEACAVKRSSMLRLNVIEENPMESHESSESRDSDRVVIQVEHENSMNDNDSMNDDRGDISDDPFLSDSDQTLDTLNLEEEDEREKEALV